jgi:ribosomal protein S18 acetylase RimI-like enzyme
VSLSLTIRTARIEDAAQMARVHVLSWQETYRGLMSEAVLDDPGLLAARERFWTTMVTDERYRENRVAVAERAGQLIGIAMSGPPWDAGSAWTRQLYVLYVHATDHGTGAGLALLEAVVGPEQSVSLWVADPNPRAQAFYRKHGFVAAGRPRSRTGCGRSAWSAVSSTVGSAGRQAGYRLAPLPGRASAVQDVRDAHKGREWRWDDCTRLIISRTSGSSRR